MHITELKMIEGDDPELASFDIYLERPYSSSTKKTGLIIAGSYINLLTKNSISFAKGLVLKKHLIQRRSKDDGEDAETKQTDEDEETKSAAMITTSGSASVNSKSGKSSKKKKGNMFLQYVIQFTNCNRKNFSTDSLGGLDYTEIEWSIE